MDLKIINIKIFDVLLLLTLIISMVFLYNKPCTEVVIIEGKVLDSHIIYDFNNKKYYLNNVSFNMSDCRLRVVTWESTLKLAAFVRNGL